MPLLPPQNENIIYTVMTDTGDPLSCYSAHSFELEGIQWPTVEHYFQAMKFEDPTQRQKVRQAESPQMARKMGQPLFKRIRPDWKKVREVVMTRAVYTKCRTHNDVSDTLLATETKTIIERSLYDYFWGCGRDNRGSNTYGKVLMNVREKLFQEQADQ